jgi:hypothetical protein
MICPENFLSPNRYARTPTKEDGTMLSCSKCGKEYTPKTKGWYERVEGLGPGGRADEPLTRVLLCPEDFAKLAPGQRRAWHEFTGDSEGPTREKRPGHLAV